jgi:predicted transcriptional regulator of viral defense system
MKSNKLLEKLNLLNKTFYTVNDILTITKQSRQTARVALSRLVKRGGLQRLIKNIYAPKNKVADLEAIAEQLDTTSYLSFESALSRYGILSQVPYAVTLATAKKSKVFDVGEQQIVYRKIKPELFGEYVLENNLRIATPEKALLDILYLISRGKAFMALDELDLSVINKKLLLQMAEKYSKKVKVMVESLVR